KAAENLRVGDHLWAGDRLRRIDGLTQLPYQTEHSEPYQQLSLSWDESRGEATNLIVRPPGALDLWFLAEAECRTAAPVAPSQLVMTRVAGEEKPIPIQRLESSDSKRSVKGFYLKEITDPWDYPVLTPHDVSIVHVAKAEVREVVRLQFQ